MRLDGPILVVCLSLVPTERASRCLVARTFTHVHIVATRKGVTKKERKNKIPSSSQWWMHSGWRSMAVPRLRWNRRVPIRERQTHGCNAIPTTLSNSHLVSVKKYVGVTANVSRRRFLKRWWCTAWCFRSAKGPTICCTKCHGGTNETSDKGCYVGLVEDGQAAETGCLRRGASVA